MKIENYNVKKITIISQTSYQIEPLWTQVQP